MEEEKKLYPVRFCTLQDDYFWGSEQFKLADLGYRDSLVRDGWLAGNSISELMDTYLDRVVGENVFDYFGRQFPICVRQLDVKGKMPLRVSPSDGFAVQRYDFLGKEKLWYVVRAGRDAGIMVGFKRDTDASELYSKCCDNTAGELMNVIAPHPGQTIHIAPGVPHAAFGDIQILEIAESSPLDFCLCSWGQEVSEDEFDPALNIVDALEFISYQAYTGDRCADATKLVDLPQFSVSGIRLVSPLQIGKEHFDSIVIYSCVKGAASVQIKVLGRTADFNFAAGDTILVPAECPDYSLVPMEKDTLVLETLVPHIEDRDGYINEEVPEKLEEEE